MYPAKYYEIPTIFACLNNLVKFEDLNGLQKFLCGLRTSIFCLVYKWHPQMYPVKFYENPTIRTCLNNLINFEAKTPPFLGVRGAYFNSWHILFHSEYESTWPKDVKCAKKKIPIVSPLKGILWGSQLKSIFGVSETHFLCSFLENNKK